MAEAVVIVGVGMMTPVGLTAAQTAASVRAGIAIYADSDVADQQSEAVTIAQVDDESLPDLHPSVMGGAHLPLREIQMLRLASDPLIECLASLAPGHVRPPLALALPDMETSDPLDGRAFLEWLAEQSENAFDLPRSPATFAGRAGGLLAIGWAADSIRAGKGAFAIAGGVDSYHDPEVLEALEIDGRLKTAVNLDGFIPGEGAAFVLLASQSAAARARLPPLGIVSRVSQGFENGHLYSDQPYRGEGLAQTVRQLVESGAVDAPYREVYSSMNGESHWAKEWGVSFIRNCDAFDPDHGLQHPADCFGDTGAACGALLVGLAAIGTTNGYRKAPSLIYCSSDRGDRAALSVTRA